MELLESSPKTTIILFVIVSVLATFFFINQHVFGIKVHCYDFHSQKEAKASGIKQLDRDGDGLYCENLPQ